MKYIGIIKDNMTGDIVRRSNHYSTWELAQKQAECNCKRLYGAGNDRYRVIVITED